MEGMIMLGFIVLGMLACVGWGLWVANRTEYNRMESNVKDLVLDREESKAKIDALTRSRDAAIGSRNNMEKSRDEAVKVRVDRERELKAVQATLTNTGNELVTRTKERDLALAERDAAGQDRHRFARAGRRLEDARRGCP